MGAAMAALWSCRSGCGAKFPGEHNDTAGASAKSCGERCIPGFGRPVVFDTKLSEFEPAFSDPVHVLIRCMSSAPAMAIEAFRNRFKPSIGPKRSWIDR
jgi:hypothetical protein